MRNHVFAKLVLVALPLATASTGLGAQVVPRSPAVAAALDSASTYLDRAVRLFPLPVPLVLPELPNIARASVPPAAESLYLRAAALYRQAGNAGMEAEALFGATVVSNLRTTTADAYRDQVLPRIRRGVEQALVAGNRELAARLYEEATRNSITDVRVRAGDSVLVYWKRALGLRRELQQSEDVVRLLLAASRVERVGTDSAADFAREARVLIARAPDLMSDVVALHTLGTVYARALRNVRASPEERSRAADSSLRYYHQARTLAATNASATDSTMRGNFLYILARAAEESARVYALLPETPAHRISTLTSSRDALRARLQLMDMEMDLQHGLAAYDALAGWHEYFGQLDSARDVRVEATKIARDKRDTASMYRTLWQLASAESRLSWGDSALSRYREIYRLTQTSNVRFNYGSLYTWLASAHQRRGGTDSALFYYRLGIDSAATMRVGVSFTGNRFSSAEMVLGNALLALDMRDSALVHFERALRHADGTEEGWVRVGGAPTTESLREGIAESATAPRTLSSAAGTAMLGIGRVSLARGDIDSALVWFRRAERTSDVSVRGDALSWIANGFTRMPVLDSALAYRRLARASYQRAFLTTGAAIEQRAEASVQRERGALDEALQLLKQSLAAAVQARSRDDQRQALRDIASIYLDADQADSALFYNRRALVLASYSDSLEIRETIFNNLGVVFTTIGQADSAVSYFSRALQINRRRGAQERVAVNLSNLGILRLRTSHDSSTYVHLREAFELRRALRVPAGEVVPRLSLAEAHALDGRVDSALIYARSALDLARATHLLRPEGRALATLGRVFAQGNQLDSAQRYLTDGLAVMRRLGYPRDVRLLMAAIGDVYRRRNTPSARQLATVYFDSAAAIIDDARRRAGSGDNEVALLETQTDVFGGWARAWLARRDDVGDASISAALGAVERGRAQSLVDMVTRLRSSERATALAALRPAVGNSLQQEVDSMLEPLRSARTAAITYLVASDTLFTWLLAPTGALTLMAPVPIREAELNRLVRSARVAFSIDEARSIRLAPDDIVLTVDSTSAAERVRSDFKRLAELLVPDALLDAVPVGTPIVIVPHGSIGLVPFSALAVRTPSTTPRVSVGSTRPRNARSESLGERHPLRFAPSFAALRASSARPSSLDRAARSSAAVAPTSGWSSTRPSTTVPRSAAVAKQVPLRVAGALVVGNPKMPYVYSGRGTTRSRLQPLPGAEAESRSIARLLGSDVVVGAAATEAHVREQMAAAPLIHFATHGLAYGTAGAARRSYVAFAPDAQHDGLLTVGELMDDGQLELRAELVVLSACQTGLGDMKKAEGSIGLQRAFLAKGARSVLVSLWNVDDKATRLLMERFYAYWLDPNVVRTKTQALQMAQEAVRRTPGYANPKYWAAFQLVGAD